MSSLVKSKEQIKLIRQSSRILAVTLRKLTEAADIGVNLLELEQLAKKTIVAARAKPAFLGYQPNGADKPYPAALCTSLNDVIVHGVPYDYVLKDGDLLSLDLGVNFQGGISDAALTIGIGNIKEEDKQLIALTKEALSAGINVIKAGKTTGDIGHAIEKVIMSHKGKIVDGLTGHGVGVKVHEEPPIFNFGDPGEGVVLEVGMVLAIEPMASMGTNKIVQLTDDSYATADKSNAAHFEHTVLVTERMGDILTI